jgi:hypothetical protein
MRGLLYAHPRDHTRIREIKVEGIDLTLAEGTALDKGVASAIDAKAPKKKRAWHRSLKSSLVNGHMTRSSLLLAALHRQNLKRSATRPSMSFLRCNTHQPNVGAIKALV